MNQLSLVILHLLFVLFWAQAQIGFTQETGPSQDAVSNFRPRLLIGILCIMFSLTFILFIYEKSCHRGGSGHGDSENGPPLLDQHLNSLESIRR